MTGNSKAVGQLSEEYLAMVLAFIWTHLKDLSTKLCGRYKLISDIFSSVRDIEAKNNPSAQIYQRYKSQPYSLQLLRKFPYSLNLKNIYITLDLSSCEIKKIV